MCQYTCAQVMGRAGVVGLRKLRSLAASGPVSAEVAKPCFDWWRHFIVNARPRSINVADTYAPLVLFTDRSVEGEMFEEVGVSGVLFDPLDHVRTSFSEAA